MTLEFKKPHNLGCLLMKSSQSNSNLRLSSSYLVCSYLITTVQFSQYVSPPESEMLELFLDLRNIWVYQNDKIYSGTPSFDPKIVLL